MQGLRMRHYACDGLESLHDNPFVFQKQKRLRLNGWRQVFNLPEPLIHKEMGKIFELCCCIFPAAPFITAQNLKNGMDTLIKHNAYSTFPVTKYSYPVQRALKIENNLLKMLYPENNEKRSQDFDPTYHDTGQFYWLDVKQFIKERKIFSDKTVPIIIPEIEAQDIDNEEDWQIAESKFKILRDLGRL